ncbi:MAG: hypothetical protein IKW81_06415 [Pseudobutyrivibrio sp.]|nr:hypothetical protein [Pseudobutyrivibrio sp.]
MKTEKKQIKNTAGMFDLFKGFTMIVIVLGHTLQEFKSLHLDNVFSLLGITVITLFVISGYGFRKKGIKKTFTQQFQLICVPYLITSVLTAGGLFFFRVLFFRNIVSAFKEMVKTFIGLLFGFSETFEIHGISLYSCGPMWYLLALFLGWNIVNIVLNYVPEKIAPIVIIVIAGVGYATVTAAFDPWSYHRGMFAALFLYIGYLCKKYKILTNTWKMRYKAILIGCFVAGIIIYLITRNAELVMTIFFPLAFICPILLIKLFLMLNCCRGFISNKIRSIGRYSMYFLCVHTFEYKAFPIYYVVERVHSYMGIAIVCIVRLVVDIALCAITVKVVDYVKQHSQAKGNTI